MKDASPTSLTTILRLLLPIVLGLTNLGQSTHAQSNGINTHHATLNRTQSQYLSASDSLSLSITGDLTIEAWVRPVSQPPTGVNYSIVDKWPSGQRAYWFTYQEDGLGIKRLYFACSSNGSNNLPSSAICTLALNTWSHVALVKQGTATVLYLNGNPIGTGTAPATMFDNSSELRVGGRVDANEPFDGNLDDVRVWAVARTQQQIRSGMFAQLPETTPDLRGYWQLNNSLADASGNGNTLSNINSVVFETANQPFMSAASEQGIDGYTKALWHLQDITDNSGRGGNLTNINGVSFLDGHFAKGASMGTNNYLYDLAPHTKKFLRIESSLGLSPSSLTIAGWFKILENPPNNGDYALCGLGFNSSKLAFGILYNKTESGYLLRWDYNKLSNSANTINLATDLNDGAYHFLVLTYDGLTLRGYLDGLKAGELSITGNGGGPDFTDNFIIGGMMGWHYPQNGQLMTSSVAADDVVLSSRAWTEEEIMKYYGGIVTARFPADAADCILRKDASTWADVRNASTANSIETIPIQPIATEKKTEASYSILSPFFPFDTTLLPSAGIEINHAALNIYLENDSTGSDGIAVVQTGQEIWNGVTMADFPRRGLIEASPRLTNKTNSAYNTWPLNAAGRSFIAQSGQTKPASASASGKTQLGLRWAKDLDNLAPTTRDYALISTAGAANRPYLLVEYTTAFSTASIVGSIQGTNLPTGAIQVVATAPSIQEATALSTPGNYTLTGLPKGVSYQVTAYVDTNDNQIHDPLEWTGDYAANPLLLDDNKTGINITLAPPVDTDADGLPDRWETTHGLNVGLNDAALDKDGDGLSNIQELWLGLGANDTDSDDDTLTDFAEVNLWGTNPLLGDSDQDGLPDRWETDHGLDPRRNDANEDHDFDFVSNRDEYNGGINSTNPGSGFSGTDGQGDYVRRQAGQSTWLALYDRNDRLLGVRDARGTSFAYRYDGNGNLTHQAKLGLDTDGDGLSDLWEFAHRLDPDSAAGVDGASGDGDSDGWTNLQEQTGQSDPLVNTEKPGSNGIVSASQIAGFVPIHFVIATGQLDNAGAEEVVVGPDGNPGATANAVSVYSATSGVFTQDGPPVDVGAYGVTSLAVGQLGTRPPAIYVGLRKPGGNGRVVELQKNGTTWQTTVIVESATEAAYVTGIRNTPTASDLIITLAPRFGPDGALYRAVHEEDRWKVSLLDPAISHPMLASSLNPATRGPGLIAKAMSAGTSDRVLRLLDTNSLQVADPKTYRNIDEFNDETLSSAWSRGGSAAGGISTWSATESGGIAQLRGFADYGIGNTASAWMQTTMPTLVDGDALSIVIPYIGESDSRSGGGCLIRLGDVTLLALGAGQNANNVVLHLFKMGNLLYFRTKKDTVPWSSWSSGEISNILRFEVSIIKNGAGPGQEARIHCDYIRYLPLSQLVGAGASATDLSNTEAAYRTANNTWYFKTPTPQSWLNAQLYAFARGSNLVTVSSADTHTWLQSKFPGEFWTGYYRDFATTSWKWVGNSAATFTAQPWASGQPSTGADQLFTFANNGTWSSATGTELKPAVFEVGAPLVEVSATVEAEPVASHRLQWAGQTLASGRFNSANPTQTSVVEALIDDKDVSGTVTGGDEFVIAELVLDSSPAQTRTLVRRPLTGGALAGSYGLTAVRNRTGTSDFLVTGEPDGQVFAWLPPSGGGPLTRHLLSVEHVGKSWHGLARVAMGGGTDGLVGLRVTPGTPQTADLVFWSPGDLGFAAPPVIQQSLPSARIAPTPASGGAQSRVDVTLWDSEGNASRIALQYQFPPLTGLWQNATLLTVGGLPATPQPALPAPASGATHATIWNATHDLVLTADTPVLLRARATDPSGAGAWSEPMYYLVETTTDTDGDGMPDTWESSHGLDPGAADGGGDLDNDGLKNLLEFALGLDPQAPAQTGLPTVFIGNAAGNPAVQGETRYLVIYIPRNSAASALSFSIEVSGNLTTWATGPAVTILENSATLLKARDNVPISPETRRFIRLKVSP